MFFKDIWQCRSGPKGLIIVEWSKSWDSQFSGECGSALAMGNTLKLQKLALKWQNQCPCLRFECFPIRQSNLLLAYQGIILANHWHYPWQESMRPETIYTWETLSDGAVLSLLYAQSEYSSPEHQKFRHSRSSLESYPHCWEKCLVPLSNAVLSNMVKNRRCWWEQTGPLLYGLKIP